MKYKCIIPCPLFSIGDIVTVKYVENYYFDKHSRLINGAVVRVDGEHVTNFEITLEVFKFCFEKVNEESY